ncbi:hypothetical protein [Desulfolutivibrio sulfoxidireducens]|uniref:hypothetical protein n=1 Tax=Desulfolutivibrio sulfoxidireducens TaxID=2773299 RepID=UPI00159DED7D|nr:hypothetical protein [Desulfolutivibrio sulfoxidireducens]QLA17535.1 hypothetical protein GD605_16325 [Desulfolutivibrio sulfoxidireducens]
MNRTAHLLFLAVVLTLALCAPGLPTAVHGAPKATSAKKSPEPSPKTPQAGDAPSVAFPISPKSFHGIAWGTSLGDIKDMTVLERHGPAIYAKIQGGTPRLGDIPVTEIVYAFCNDRFAGSMATFPGKDRFAAVKDLLASRHGQPVKPDETSENVGWPLGDVLIMLEFDAILNVGTLNYVHVLEYGPCTAPDGAKPSQEAKPAQEAKPQDAP